MHEPWAIVSLDQVAEHISTIDLGITGSAYINKSIEVAQYLGNGGLLERYNDGWWLFSITQPGINEVEREISTQRASANQSVAPLRTALVWKRYTTWRGPAPFSSYTGKTWPQGSAGMPKARTTLKRH